MKRLDKEAAARVGWPDIGGAALRELVRGCGGCGGKVVVIMMELKKIKT